MTKRPIPTIKGVFVNSHVNMVRKLKGEEGLKQMETRYGRPLRFKYLEEVPVRDEVRIIEIALDLVSEKRISRSERSFEAGRLHFRNFAGTPLGKLVMLSLPRNFKTIMMRIPHVASHVFRHVGFTVKDLGDRSVSVLMENNDYPIEHFRGVFYAWLVFRQYKGSGEAKEIPGNIYRYIISWK